MSPMLTHPGVYVQEVPGRVGTVMGVATSITAFVGAANRGPLITPMAIASWTDFERVFGGLSRGSPLSYAVAQFFANGGSSAIVTRVAKAATAATGQAGSGTKLALAAVSPGAWGSSVQARVTISTQLSASPDELLFNLSVRDAGTGLIESFPNVSPTQSHPRYVDTMLSDLSGLVRLDGVPQALPGSSTGTDADFLAPDAWAPFSGGEDGATVDAAAVAAGLAALDRIDLFNLLVVPPFAFDANGDRTDVDASTRAASAKLAGDKRAIYLADAPLAWGDASAPTTAALSTLGLDANANTAMYFPGIRLPDPLRERAAREFAPAGAVAGLIARNDATHGVWKAPAGVEATLAGVIEPAVRMSDAQQELINLRGINVLRAFSTTGTVVWGARMLQGTDAQASDWKYLPVRRLALFLEGSLHRGTQWTVFEPNDEPLWAKIRLSVGAFLQELFEQGAFAGTSPHAAYMVKCDSDTTTQADVDTGVFNILVGFAPLKPAEFVMLKLQQIAGQAG